MFASELKALVVGAGHRAQRRPGGARRLGAVLLVAAEERRGPRACSKLPAGSWAECRRDGTCVRGTVLGPVRRGAPAAASGPPADLREIIEASVAAHLVADVPVATFLSGGLDSSLVTALAAPPRPRRSRPTRSPSGAEDQRLEAMPDDAALRPQDGRAPRHPAARDRDRSPDVVDMLPRMVDILDEPIGDPAAINTLLICEAARDAGVKVLLSGMGADELFGGYRKHLACLLGRPLPAAARGCCAAAIVAPTVGPAARSRPAGRGLRYGRGGPSAS